MMPEREIVISLRRGVPLADIAEKPTDSLEVVVRSIATVRVTDVLSAGRCLVVKASDQSRTLLEDALGDACHFVDRAKGHVL